MQERESLKVSLESQIHEVSFRRLELKMTERERQLHLGSIQRQAPPTFMSVPRVHPREIPLMRMLPKLAKSSSMANSFEVQPFYKQTSSYSALLKSMDAAARDFYGVESVNSPPRIANEYRRVEYSYDTRRHDPIGNHNRIHDPSSFTRTRLTLRVSRCSRVRSP